MLGFRGTGAFTIRAYQNTLRNNNFSLPRVLYRGCRVAWTFGDGRRSKVHSLGSKLTVINSGSKRGNEERGGF